jgi:hypothetical protein
MNKVEVGLLIAVVGVLLYIGGVVYFEMVTTLEQNPDIEYIGPPGLQPPKLEYLTAIVIVAAIFCGICLKIKPKEENDKLGVKGNG